MTFKETAHVRESDSMRFVRVYRWLILSLACNLLEMQTCLPND